MRKMVLAAMLAAFLFAGCDKLRYLYSPGGYAGLEHRDAAVHYVVRIVSPGWGYEPGTVLIAKQNYMHGEDYAVFRDRAPIPVLIWKDGRWHGVNKPKYGDQRERLEPGTFKLLNAGELQKAGVAFVPIEHRAAPELRDKPPREDPYAVVDSTDYSHVELAVGDAYIRITLMGKEPVQGYLPEHSVVYWVNPDRSFQVRNCVWRQVMMD